MFIDITGPKVIIPTLIFMALNFQGIRPDLLHVSIFVPAYFLVAKMNGIQLTVADLVVPTMLYMLLSPGVIFQVPSSGGVPALLAHTLLFATLFAFLRGQFPRYY